MSRCRLTPQSWKQSAFLGGHLTTVRPENSSRKSSMQQANTRGFPIVNCGRLSPLCCEPGRRRGLFFSLTSSRVSRQNARAASLNRSCSSNPCGARFERALRNRLRRRSGPAARIFGRSCLSPPSRLESDHFFQVGSPRVLYLSRKEGRIWRKTEPPVS